MVQEDRGLDAVPWEGENMGWSVVYIPNEHGTREAGTIVIIRSGVSKRCSPGY